MTKNHVTILLFVVLLILAFWGGWKTYPKFHPYMAERDTIKLVPDVKYASVGLSYASGRGLIGVGYIPYYKGVVVTGGFKLIRFRQR